MATSWFALSEVLEYSQKIMGNYPIQNIVDYHCEELVYVEGISPYFPIVFGVDQFQKIGDGVCISILFLASMDVL